jgi:thiamine biosynthesis lipoprotein
MPLVERLPLREGAREFAVWGTVARVVVADPSCADAAEHLVRGQLDLVDEACSRFRPSELSAVRWSARVSPLLASLVAAALDSAAETGGDVDPTLGGDLVALGYDRDFAADLPVRVRVERRVRHRWQEISLADGVLTLPPGCSIDLGASAKAYAADLCATLVHEALGCDVLVSLGGDVSVAGASGWPVLVSDGVGEPAARVLLSGGGLATSSTISRAWGPGMHHILDPVRGMPAEPVWRTVSVVAPSCRRANALSTAAVVRGLAAPEWLRSLSVPARLVGRDGSVVRLGGWPPDTSSGPPRGETS